MEAIAISKFKATCLAVLERVRRTGEPVLVTKRGVPVAEVVPASRTPAGERELGDLADTARITGDIVSPVAEPGEWEALADSD
ncbi:MAG TPA: type II toxin-antitoxin system Phd/YefM family antitoxin [Solirubrobacterales bacterium]|nr:type II toxin-antitoxin system Phd/YefM family antitoxin [Solirubrobacterales bacterium]